MSKQLIRKTTEAVIKVYKKENPSFVQTIDGDEYFGTWSKFTIHKLKMPPIAFQGSRLLDVGCGTGEKSLVYARLGATVEGIDANEKAIQLAVRRAKEWKLNGRASFKTQSVFELDVKGPYDIVVSDGMIHHTADPKRAFGRFAPLVKGGGVLILGLAEPSGFFQRQLQRYFVNRIAGGGDEECKVQVASMLFGTIIRRASKSSGRSIKSTVYDSFINPQVIPISIGDLRNWMSHYGIELDTTWPPLGLPVQADSQYHPLLPFSHEAVKQWENITRLFWLLNDENDAVRFRKYSNYHKGLACFLEKVGEICGDRHLNRMAIGDVLDKIGGLATNPMPGYQIGKDARRLLNEVLLVDHRIDSLSKEKKDPVAVAKSIKFKRLFSGFSGVGMVYYRGTKSL